MEVFLKDIFGIDVTVDLSQEFNVIGGAENENK